MELLDYEKKHIDFLRENASECCLFLKKDDSFPINKPCKICLVGNGVRHTIKGGTGSGDVASRFFINIEEAFKEEGFEITSTKWLDSYDELLKTTIKEFVKNEKKEARKNGYLPVVYSMGYFDYERDYDFAIDYDGDICVYVLSRNSGEGNDRKNIKGDVKLSDSEVRDILYLNKKFSKFMLVLNVGGVVDLSLINDEVKNILLLSQLGVVTSYILPSIILGKDNPTGKLSSSWDKLENYPFYNEFGNIDDTRYKEGIYVGYRYFLTSNKMPLYSFGYGLSYSSFDISVTNTSIDNTILSIDVKIKNISEFKGKEVVQVYVTKPNDYLDNPIVELVDYQKTNELAKNEEEIINFKIDLTSLASYDFKRALYLLLKGEYIFHVGNSSINLKAICKCKFNDEVIIERLNNKCGSPDFIDLKLNRETLDSSNLTEYVIDTGNIKEKVVVYKKDEYIDSSLNDLNNEELAYMCLGHYEMGLASVVGNSCKHVLGGAGETTLSVSKINKSLTMADGPAGIRIKQTYGVDKKGAYDIVLDPMMEKMLLFIPKIAWKLFVPSSRRKGEVFHQYTTAIPIGTALASSFNDLLVYNIGRLIQDEMTRFNVDLWLAPALNIHRSILCGRNFEYYSEDPYLTGRIASSMIKGVEDNSNKGTTIKHFCANNQELNRNNNDSKMSERALREIYLKAFEMCIKNANPKALMTSYNLLNGVHTSESYELVNDILRCEWGYNGLVMTDWIASGRSFCKKAKYKAPYASNNILAGNDLTMPGCKKDLIDIKKALKSNKLTRNDLLISASRINRSINKQKQVK